MSRKMIPGWGQSGISRTSSRNEEVSTTLQATAGPDGGSAHAGATCASAGVAGGHAALDRAGSSGADRPVRRRSASPVARLRVERRRRRRPPRRRLRGFDATAARTGTPTPSPAANQRLRRLRRRRSASARYCGSRSLPPRQDRRGDEDRRVRADEQAGGQARARSLRATCAPKMPVPTISSDSTGMSATNDVESERISTWLSERLTISPYVVRPVAVSAVGSPDLVEHDDGVVERETQNGEEGGDRRRRDLEVEERVHADREDDVVDHRDDRGRGHLELEADRQVHGEQEEEVHERLLGLVAHLVYPTWGRRWRCSLRSC